MTSDHNPNGLRKRPPVFRALGRQDPPPVVQVDAHAYELEEILKHDSWAATALYRRAQEKIVVKFNRRQPVFFVPMTWLGRWLCRREDRAFRLLANVPGIPPCSGSVRVNGKSLLTAFAHYYIEGHPLGMEERPGERFFKQLEEMVLTIHRRGMAYADLNKRENIIVTESGAPLLVDFQIHFAPSRRMMRFPPVRWLLHQLQAADLYHLRKHLLWHRPDLIPPEARDLRPFRPFATRLWRIIYVAPVQFFRRRLLVRLRIRSGKGLAFSEVEPEKAVRLALERKTRR